MHLNEIHQKKLKHWIHTYLEGHESRSIATLAKKANVGQSTLRRIIQGQANNPEFETLIAILKVILSNDELASFIEGLDPDLSKTMKTIYCSSSSKTSSQSNFLRALEDELGYFIYELSNLDGGTTREDIVRLFGISALDTLDQLIEDKFLIETNGTIFGKKLDKANLPAKTSLKTLQHCLKRFDTSMLNKDIATFFLVNGSLSLLGLYKVKSLLDSLHLEIEQVKRVHKGNIRFYSASFMNIFDKSQYNNTKVPSRSSDLSDNSL